VATIALGDTSRRVMAQVLHSVVRSFAGQRLMVSNPAAEAIKHSGMPEDEIEAMTRWTVTS
jgi:hypothetical protein